MTDKQKDNDLSPEEENVDVRKEESGTEEVPELELEDVSWEIEEDDAPAVAEEEPPAVWDPSEIADRTVDEGLEPTPAEDMTASAQEAEQPADEGPDYGEPEDDGPDYGEPEDDGPDYGEPEDDGPDYGEPEPPGQQDVATEPPPPPEPEAADEPAPAPEPPPEPAPEPPPAAGFVEEEEETDADYTADWGWRTVRGSFRPFVFESLDEQYMFSSGGIQRVESLEGMNKFFRYLVDYPDAMGMGLLTLSAERRYADVLARKQLEEAGELNPEGHLHVFDKRKLEDGQQSVFYEVLPRDKYATLNQEYTSSTHGFVFYDTVSLLFGLLKKRGKGVHALALHLPGTILLVAGRDGKVHLARRYTLIGDDAQAFAEGIFALEQDLGALEKNIGQRIGQAEWIEGMTTTLNLPLPSVDIPLVPMPLHELDLDGERVWTALPQAMNEVPMKAILGPKEELWLRPLERAEKWVWAVLLAVAVVTGAGVYTMLDATQRSQATLQTLRNTISMKEADVQALATDEQVENVGPAAELAADFTKAALNPPFGEMWNFLASLRPQYVRVDGLEFNYVDEGVAVRMEGQVEMDLTTAQQGFTRFLKRLEESGFIIESQKVDLGLEGNFYALNALWPVKEKGE